MALQNFVHKTLPAISAAWLNAVDVIKFTIFADATTKAQARAALTSDAPMAIGEGGTGATTAGGARTALGATATGDAVFIAASASAGRVALDAVGLTGNETIAGNKTLSGTTALQALLDISHASAGQIKFPAAQNASADVNTLDDYEEGTWTPTVGGTSTYTSQSGVFVKVGKLVFARFSFQINVIGTGSQFRVTDASGNLPAPASTGPINISSWAALATAVFDVRGAITSSTQLDLYGTTAANADSSTGGTLVLFQNSANIVGSVVYIASN